MLSIYPTKKYHRDGFHPGPAYTHPLATFALVFASISFALLILAAGFGLMLGGYSLPI